MALLLAVVTAAAPLNAQSTGPAATVLLAGSSPTACADSVAPPPAQREAASYRPVQRRGIAVPPLSAGAPRHRTITVEFHVDARGRVDSVAIEGEVAPDYREALRATLMTHTFWPAVYRGCAVPGRMAVELSFH